MVEHVNIDDANIHEPKGAASAAAGAVYVSDGAGSGSWETAAYGGIFSEDSDSVTISTIGTTVKKFAAFSQTNPSQGVTTSFADDQITVLSAGDYQIIFNATVQTVASGDAGNYQWHIRINDVETTIGVHKEMTGSSDQGSIACQGIKTLAANDVISVWIESDSGADTDDITVPHCSLSVIKLGV